MQKSEYPAWLNSILKEYDKPGRNYLEVKGDSQDLKRVSMAGQLDKVQEIMKEMNHLYETGEGLTNKEKPWESLWQKFQDFRSLYPKLYRTMEIWVWG